jgi:enoyl-CoA hydratase/methylglutaconyl-CoA hydratase
MPELVHLEVADGVATVTLDSPHNRNALSRQLVSELFDRLDRAEEDDDVKVVLLRSADRVFCSGADLSEASADGMVEGARTIVELQRRIVASPKPVVVRLDGPVRAGGIGIVAASDIVIAAGHLRPHRGPTRPGRGGDLADGLPPHGQPGRHPCGADR